MSFSQKGVIEIYYFVKNCCVNDENDLNTFFLLNFINFITDSCELYELQQIVPFRSFGLFLLINGSI